MSEIMVRKATQEDSLQIARVLFSKAVDYATLKHNRLYVWVLEDNVKARAFYEKMGGVLTLPHKDIEIDGRPYRDVKYCWDGLIV